MRYTPWRLPNSLQDLSAHTRVLLWLMPLLLLHAGHLHLSLLALWLSLWAGWNYSESLIWRFLARPTGLLLVVAAAAWVGPPKSVDFQVSVLLLLSAILYARPQPKAPIQLDRLEGQKSRTVGGSKESNEIVSGMALTVAVFLTGSLFLLTQDLVLVFLACLWLIVFLVVTVVENFGVSLRDFRLRVGVLAWILGLSSLAAAVLFLLIPRIPVGLAGPIGFDKALVVSGVSDRLDPKAFGPVSLNAAADYAVRVIDGALPDQPYWRVHTLDRFIGGQWSSSASKNERGVDPAPSSSSKLLELSSAGVRYSLQSLRSLDQPPPKLDLSGSPPTLIGEAHSKSLWEWARADRLLYTSDQAWLDSLLNRFRSGFKYNLNVANSRASDPLAEFFFSTKQGYCSHFAATLAELLRANGIPVQLVTGYLGADFNASGNFYTLRQSQAHVWLEVSLDGDPRVLRIDPTLGIPPAADSMSPEIIQREFGVYGVGASTWQSWATLQSWRYRLEAWRINASREFMAIGYEGSVAAGKAQGLFERFSIEHLSTVLGFFSLCFLMVALLVWRASGSQRSASMTDQLVRRLMQLSVNAETPFGIDPAESRIDFVRRWASFHGKPLSRIERFAMNCLRFDYGAPMGGQRLNRKRWLQLLKRRLRRLSI